MVSETLNVQSTKKLKREDGVLLKKLDKTGDEAGVFYKSTCSLSRAQKDILRMNLASGKRERP